MIDEIVLHKGELEAIILARDLKATLATDDGKAIKACKFLGIAFIVTPKITLELFASKHISYYEAEKVLEKLRIIGRYSPEIIANAFLKLMEVAHVKSNNNKSTGRYPGKNK